MTKKKDISKSLKKEIDKAIEAGLPIMRASTAKLCNDAETINELAHGILEEVMPFEIAEKNSPEYKYARKVLQEKL